jgi:LacI family transcriptional regulator
MVRKSASGRIGIADVAVKAGVSHATVSRVMNGNFTVDPEIAARVRAAALELKYQPNPVGRSLALGKTDTIGIVVPDLANPTFQAILRGLSRAAAQDGYRVLIADSFEVSSEETILAGEARRRCDGLVLCAPRMSDAELEEIAPSLRPLVLINRTTAAAGVPSLVVDYGQGVQDIAEHLVDLGHTRLAFLAGPPRSASNNLRLQGLEAFKAAHPQVEVTMLEGGSDFDTGHEAVDAVLESGATGNAASTSPAISPSPGSMTSPSPNTRRQRSPLPRFPSPSWASRHGTSCGPSSATKRAMLPAAATSRGSKCVPARVRPRPPARQCTAERQAEPSPASW